MSIWLKLPAPLAFEKQLKTSCNKLEEAGFFLKATKGVIKPPLILAI